MTTFAEAFAVISSTHLNEAQFAQMLVWKEAFWHWEKNADLIGLTDQELSVRKQLLRLASHSAKVPNNTGMHQVCVEEDRRRKGGGFCPPGWDPSFDHRNPTAKITK